MNLGHQKSLVYGSDGVVCVNYSLNFRTVFESVNVRGSSSDDR